MLILFGFSVIFLILYIIYNILVFIGLIVALTHYLKKKKEPFALVLISFLFIVLILLNLHMLEQVFLIDYLALLQIPIDFINNFITYLF